MFKAIFVLVFIRAVMASFDDDDEIFSLSGLTQSSPKIDHFSSDDEGCSNLSKLMECAKQLGESSRNEQQDFDDFVFNIGMDSQVSQVDLHNISFVDIETIEDEMPSKRMRTSMADHITDVRINFSNSLY